MNRDEILNYLMGLRHVTAPVAIAENNLRRNQDLYDKAKKKWWLPIGICVVFTIGYMSMVGDGDKAIMTGNQFGGVGGLLVFGGLTVLFLYLKFSKQGKLKRSVDGSTDILMQEKSNPEYQNGLNGFPAKFYHYSEIYRLWKLISEGRAETLKEAYNLLETQHFYEDQLSMQEEMRNLQQDIAFTGKVTAVASVVSAINTTRIANKR